ncbi:MAG: hypothetical protein KKE24_06940 [Candidatus Thermoplasmatota archaeon]|nr:hypothetical protein [Candidatus Thermoplasmatota archaeon]
MARQWNDFRRALRKDDRVAFDSLMNRARMHASAATYAISMDPTESALLSMLLEHEKELLALRKKNECSEEDGSVWSGESDR